MNRKIIDTESAFTGLEAAIVLIAFVVVAAVFSYVVLGAGFFTTQKSQETVYSATKQATSSFEVIGSVYGMANETNAPYLSHVKFTIGNTAGGTAVDMTKVVVEYTDESQRWYGDQYGVPKNITETDLFTNSTPMWGILDRVNADTDDLLEPGEQYILGIKLPTSATPNTAFTLTLQPASGAAYPIVRRVPAGIDKVNILGT
ncbi:MAG: flagellin [Methanolinea sp.]|jgi:flagellin FlaB|nr:flagellin [Methanolinea sp.]